MVTLHDFGAFAVWLVFLVGFVGAHRRGYLEYNLQDRIFLSLVALVFLELLWLRFGYPAP